MSCVPAIPRVMGAESFWSSVVWASVKSLWAIGMWAAKCVLGRDRCGPCVGRNGEMPNGVWGDSGISNSGM